MTVLAATAEDLAMEDAIPGDGIAAAEPIARSPEVSIILVNWR
jgi:hypothetical protein